MPLPDLDRSPIAGAQYIWTAEHSPPRLRAFLSWMQGWVTFVAWQAAVPAVCFLIATMVQGLVVFNYPSYVPQRWHATLLMIGWSGLACLGKSREHRSRFGISLNLRRPSQLMKSSYHPHTFCISSSHRFLRQHSRQEMAAAMGDRRGDNARVSKYACPTRNASLLISTAAFSSSLS